MCYDGVYKWFTFTGGNVEYGSSVGKHTIHLCSKSM